MRVVDARRGSGSPTPTSMAASGSDCHPILRRGPATDSVNGAYLALNADELAATDDYEVDDYAVSKSRSPEA